MQLAAEVAEQRPPLVGKRRGEPRRRVERLRDLEEVGRIEPTAPGGTLDPRPDVVRRPDPDPRPILEQRPSLVRLIEATRHDHPVTRRFERLGKPPRRIELGGVGEALADLRNSRSAIERLSVGSGRASAQGGRPGRRGMARDHERRVVGPRRTGVGDPDSRRGSDGRRGSSICLVSSRSRDSASHRSAPVHATSIPKAAATRPGPLARR